MLLLLLRIVQVLDETKWARTAAERTSQVCAHVSLLCVPRAKPVLRVLLAFNKPVYKGIL